MFDNIIPILKEKQILILLDKKLSLKNISKSIYLYFVLKTQNSNVKILGNFENIEKKFHWLLKLNLTKEMFTQEIADDNILINLDNSISSVWTHNNDNLKNQVIYITNSKYTHHKDGDILIQDLKVWNNIELIFKLKETLKVKIIKDIALWQALGVMCNNGSFISTTNQIAPVDMYIDALKLLDNKEIEYMKNHKKLVTRKSISNNGWILSEVKFNDKIALREFKRSDINKDKSLKYAASLFKNIENIDWTLVIIKNEDDSYEVIANACYSLIKEMFEYLKISKKEKIILANQEKLDKFLIELNKLSHKRENPCDCTLFI
ncbi:MAG: hypothetical protein GY679_04560 [Mycoplasma sp.]|nr:hypothetical protein [Mycoplasma sp.]